MVDVMGRDPATQLDMIAQVNKLVINSTGGRADAVEGYREQMEQLRRTMGAEFANRYEESLKEKIAQDRAAPAAHFGRSEQLFANAQAGALISQAKVASFLKSGAAKAVLKDLGPATRRALEERFKPVEPDKTPDDHRDPTNDD